MSPRPIAPEELPKGFTLGRLAERIDWGPGLATFQVDCETDAHVPGQFVQLALIDADGQFVKRAYSLSSAPGAPLETYVIEVPGGRLTSQLFRLSPGDPIGVSRAPAGHFTLERVPAARDLWLVATGTGLSPFISMLRDGGLWDRYERVVVVHGVRTAAELSYRDEILGHGAAWIPVVSREPGRVTLPASDADGPRALVQGRATDALVDGRLEAAAGVALSPADSQVMLCGNPAMIKEMFALLEARGLQKNRPREPGQVTCERFW